MLKARAVSRLSEPSQKNKVRGPSSPNFS